MHDGIEIERRGTTAAVICTDAFVTMARAIARAQGVPDYPFAVVPHPITSLDEAGIQAKARLALPQVLQLLLSKA